MTALDKVINFVRTIAYIGVITFIGTCAITFFLTFMFAYENGGTIEIRLDHYGEMWWEYIAVWTGIWCMMTYLVILVYQSACLHDYLDGKIR